MSTSIGTLRPIVRVRLRGHADDRGCELADVARRSGRRRYARPMADLSDVRRTALSLPAAQERDSRGRAQWWVKDKMFVWERPLRPREVQELGDAAPDGPILGVRVEDLGA